MKFSKFKEICKKMGVDYKKYINNKNYMSLRSLITTGNIVNKDFAFNKIPFELDVFDEETFQKSKT